MANRARLRIGTRGSPLARAQAEFVRARIAAANGLEPAAVEIVVIRTTGDKVRDRPLADLGGKGLFTKSVSVDALYLMEIGFWTMMSDDASSPTCQPLARKRSISAWSPTTSYE
jgi:hypothetical protein